MKFYVWSTMRREESRSILWHYVISMDKTRDEKPTKIISLAAEDPKAVEGYFAERHEYCPCFDDRKVPDEVKRLYNLMLGTDALVEGKGMEEGGD